MARFVEKWTHPDYPPEPVVEPALRMVEDRLGVRLPKDYRQAILDVGLPRPSASLLSTIVERELPLSDVSDFYSPSEIIEETLGWREVGMPDSLVAFAGDCSGNKFCFDGDRIRMNTRDALTVWLFDHDYERVEAVAPDFAAWIEAFCEVEPVE